MKIKYIKIKAEENGLEYHLYKIYYIFGIPIWHKYISQG